MIESKKPLVTFALFTYNHASYVKDVLHSALAQDYEPLEIIVSDDCSSDGTYQIIEAFLNDYKSGRDVRLLHNKSNLGIGAHVQKIFSLASGEIVVMAAGDDISIPIRVSTIVDRFLVDSSVLGLVSAFEFMDKNGEQVNREWRPNGEEQTIENYTKGLIHCPGASCAWSKSLLHDWPMIDGVVHEDRVLPMRAALLGGKIFCSNDVLVRYRASGGVSHAPKYQSSLDPIVLRISALDRIRPDALQRLLDFESRQNIYLGRSDMHLNLSRTLFRVDQELNALRKGGLHIDFHYLSKFFTEGFSFEIILFYLKLRTKILISLIRKKMQKF